MVPGQPRPLWGGAAVGAFARLLRHALAKNPADRPATAAAMAAELRDAMALAETAGAGGAPPPLARPIVPPIPVLRPDPETDFLAFHVPHAAARAPAGIQSLVL